VIKTRRKFKFIRQESWRYKRVKNIWRKPKGNASRMRKRMSRYPKLVSVGFGTKKDKKGLHPSKYAEIMIYNQDQLDGLNHEKEAIKIAAQVGERKRISIIEKAEKLGLKVLNPPHLEEEISAPELEKSEK
jgi:large subunit ribosomal protein L32e